MNTREMYRRAYSLLRSLDGGDHSENKKLSIVANALGISRYSTVIAAASMSRYDAYAPSRMATFRMYYRDAVVGLAVSSLAEALKFGPTTIRLRRRAAAAHVQCIRDLQQWSKFINPRQLVAPPRRADNNFHFSPQHAGMVENFDLSDIPF